MSFSRPFVPYAPGNSCREHTHWSSRVSLQAGSVVDALNPRDRTWYAGYILEVNDCFVLVLFEGLPFSSAYPYPLHEAPSFLRVFLSHSATSLQNPAEHVTSWAGPAEDDLRARLGRQKIAHARQREMNRPGRLSRCPCRVGADETCWRNDRVRLVRRALRACRVLTAILSRAACSGRQETRDRITLAKDLDQ
eukprot:g29790.t1